MHTVRSARLEVSVARVGDLLDFAEQEDEEIRYWQGTSWQPFAAELAALPAGVRYWSREQGMFVARERNAGRLVASLTLYVQPSGQMHIGGSVVAAARRQGYGREALALVCAIAHRHLGLPHLFAGCEVSNVASRRWLASAGFTRSGVDPRHVLPDGREIESLWWQRSDPHARRRCSSFQSPGLTLLFP